MPVLTSIGVLGYDNGEHAGGTDTPPAFTHAHAAGLVEDLQGRLNRLKIEQQGFQESNLPVDYARKIEQFEHALSQQKAQSKESDVLDVPMPCFLMKDNDRLHRPVPTTSGRHASEVVPAPLSQLLSPGIVTSPQKTVPVIVQHTSFGSIGHPMTCAPACKYIKRKGGCREGANCAKCHMCFWSRHPELSFETTSTADRSGAESLIMSAGTRGHPNSCARACRYLRRKQGCRDGAACTHCHACFWHRRTTETTPAADSSPAVQANLEVEDALEQSGGMAMAPYDFAVDLCPTVGSWGHPVRCAPACPHGPGECKAGKQCQHCHLCRWSSHDLALGRKTFSL